MHNPLYTKIYTPIALGFTILFVILVSRPVLAEYTARDSEIQSLETELSKKKIELNALSNLQQELINTASGSALKKRVDRYGKKFNEADIMETVMILPEQTRPNPNGTYNLMVKSFSVSKGSKLPSGLSLANVSVAIQAKDITTIIDYITFLTQDAPMAFTIDSISLPLDTNPDGATES
jgi:hypothetical protein